MASKYGVNRALIYLPSSLAVPIAGWGGLTRGYVTMENEFWIAAQAPEFLEDSVLKYL